MSIISNYENLNPNYSPNNMYKRQIFKREEYQHSLPYKVYDISGDFECYSWNYNDSLSISFNINPIITVEQDALIYTNADEAPDENTVGRFGQFAYNTYDLKCWICKTFDQNTNIWELQSEFTYPYNATGKPVVLCVYKDIEQYTGKVIFYSFRWEEVISFDIVGNDSVSIEITPDISKKLIKGIYYGAVELNNDNSSIKIYTAPMVVR